MCSPVRRVTCDLYVHVWSVSKSDWGLSRPRENDSSSNTEFKNQMIQFDASSSEVTLFNYFLYNVLLLLLHLLVLCIFSSPFTLSFSHFLPPQLEISISFLFKVFHKNNPQIQLSFWILSLLIKLLQSGCKHCLYFCVSSPSTLPITGYSQTTITNSDRIEKVKYHSNQNPPVSSSFSVRHSQIESEAVFVSALLASVSLGNLLIKWKLCFLVRECNSTVTSFKASS